MAAQLLAKRPKIKILLYTDDPTAISEGKNLLGLSSMIERLKAHAPVSSKDLGFAFWRGKPGFGKTIRGRTVRHRLSNARRRSVKERVA